MHQMHKNKNMFLVCVTVGIVLLASKYRSNVLRSVKKLCLNIRRRNNSDEKECNQSNNNIQFRSDKIILADSPEKCDYAIQCIHCDLSNGILGFDCEWVNEGPVSLLQLATNSGVCALFRLSKIGYVPPKLKELLSNRRVLKVGVAPYEDGKKLTKDYGCRVFGTVDLRTLADKLGLPSPKSLAALSLHYLSTEMDKIVEVRCGNWDADTLSQEQITYAAYDAMASNFIYHRILEDFKHNQSLWESFIIYFRNMWKEDEDEKYHCLPTGVIDERFKAPCANKATNNSISNNNNNNNNNAAKNKNREKIEIINNKIVQKSSCLPARTKPLYHNCYLQAPDGDLLCTCDRKKAEWYIAKGLGEHVKDDPFTVRLKFEPSGRATGEVGQYYTQVKLNQCVVCGSTDKFIRKNVVPREYRKYFPVVMKAHQSHDVLLLCPPCHEISNYNDLQLRRQLAEMCNAPLSGPISHTRDKYTQDWRKLHSAVKALRENAMLPSKRQKELEQYIMDYTGTREVTTVLLDMLYKDLRNGPPIQNIESQRNKCQPHGVKVVEYFEQRGGGLIELERLWREHFVLTMKPQYLPKLWSISHNQERLSIRQTENRIQPGDAKVAGILS